MSFKAMAWGISSMPQPQAIGSTPITCITTNQELVMNKNILTECCTLINHHIIMQEKLLEYHVKADAMLRILIESNLSRHSRSTMSYYLWGVRDIIHQAQTLNEFLLDSLTKIAILLERSKISDNKT
jgi:hypothetical protein